MSDMSSLPRLDDRIEEILMSYLKVESFTNTKGETAVDAFFNKTVESMPYFQNRPTQYGQYDISDDPLNRHVNYAYYKGSKETYVLLHHSDVVNVNNYGAFKTLAFEPQLLEKAYLNDDTFIDTEAKEDLYSGEYLWGRGVADMKGGGAIQLALLEYYSTVKIKPSVILLAVPDEENQSLGMRTAISLLQELKEEHDLNYKLMINSEPHQRLNQKQGVISQGSIGKLNIFVHVKGVLAHAGKALEGINPNGLLSYIVSRVDLSDDFVNETESEMSIPPTWVLMRDNKTCYDISFPTMSYGLLNVLSFTDTPLTILSKLKHICREAVDDYIEHVNCKRRKFSEKTSRNWTDLKKGDFVYTLDEFITSNNLSDHRLVDYPEDIEKVLKSTNDGEPLIVIGILPPYYPAVTNKYQEELLNLVNNFTQNNYQQKYENRMYFTGISDLSYSQLPSKEIENEMANILGWKDNYDIPFQGISEIEMPCINIGPWGKDFHKPSERVLKQDLFIRTPHIINHTILNY